MLRTGVSDDTVEHREGQQKDPVRGLFLTQEQRFAEQEEQDGERDVMPKLQAALRWARGLDGVVGRGRRTFERLNLLGRGVAQIRRAGVDVDDKKLGRARMPRA